MLEAFVERAKTLGMKNLALTDHGVMMGSLEFYRKCKEKGVKPVVGVEAYVTNDPDDMEKGTRTRDNFHLVLLAQNNVGLENLYWLVSRAQLNNFYHKPRISKFNLTPERTEGIIATSACLGNECNRRGGYTDECRVYNEEDITRIASWYKEAFNGRYHLEIQDNDDPAGQQKLYNETVIKIGKQLNIPMVITSDAHYTTLEQAETHTMLMAMQLKKTIQDYTAASEMKYGPWFYVRSPEEMMKAAQKYNCEEAFWNACKIGRDCNVDITLGKYHTPVFDVTAEPDFQEFLKTRHEEENHNG